MNRKVSIGLSLIALCLASLFSCSNEPKTTGTATDTENTIAGIVVDSSGQGIVGVQVRLVSDSVGYGASASSLTRKLISFDPSTPITAVSDEQGRFRLVNVSDSAFSLDFRLESNGMTSHVQLLKNLKLSEINQSQLDSVRLLRPSVLVGSLTYLAGDDPLYKFSEHFRAGIQGTGITAPVLAGRSFTLNGIPPGPQTLLIFPADQYLVQTLVRAGLPLDSLVRRVPLVFPEADTLFAQQLVWRLPPDFKWELIDSTLSRRPIMQGCVLGRDLLPKMGVQVRLITDFNGFIYANEGVAEFPVTDSTLAVTDSAGCWTMPLWADTFNLEYLYWSNGSITQNTLQKGFRKADWNDQNLVQIDTAILRLPAMIRGMTRYTSEPSAWIELGSHFKVGIAGTSRYIHTRSDALYDIAGLPDSIQTLIFYPGDPFLWREFELQGLSVQGELVQDVQFVHLTAGSRLEMQAVTYTLPPIP